MNNRVDIIFSTAERSEWVQYIVECRELIEKGCTELYILIDKNVAMSAFEPMHFVTLSCLIDIAKIGGARIWLTIENDDLRAFVLNDVRFIAYWKYREIPYYREPEQKPYNLWRIKYTAYYNYTMALNLFFQNVYFRGKDLSGLNNCIAELFQNVFDHAEADGTAFSYIEYKENVGVISIAVCDFGKGIPETLKSQYPDAKQAMEMCLKPGITAGSKKHNKGYGMQNIVSTMTDKDSMTIISNRTMLNYHNNHNELHDLDYNFKGTLLFLTIHIDSFEDEEIIETFTF